MTEIHVLSTNFTRKNMAQTPYTPKFLDRSKSICCGGVKFFSRVLTWHAHRASVTENAIYRRLISILMPYKAIEVLYILL